MIYLGSTGSLELFLQIGMFRSNTQCSNSILVRFKHAFSFAGIKIHTYHEIEPMTSTFQTVYVNHKLWTHMLITEPTCHQLILHKNNLNTAEKEVDTKIILGNNHVNYSQVIVDRFMDISSYCKTRYVELREHMGSQSSKSICTT